MIASYLRGLNGDWGTAEHAKLNYLGNNEYETVLRVDGVCGAWGGIAAGIFGQQAFWGLGGVSFASQVVGTLAGITVALVGALIVYGVLSKMTGLRLSEEDEFNGADLSIHKISSINED